MKAHEIKTIQDAERFIDGVINDFVIHGVSGPGETKEAFLDYTIKIQELMNVHVNKVEVENTVLKESLRTIASATKDEDHSLLRHVHIIASKALN